MKLQTALCFISRQARRGFSCKVPTFPDPPCEEPDPKCHWIRGGNCQRAREVLNRKLPREKFLDEYHQLVEKCCVLRSAHKRPCDAQTKQKIPKQNLEPEPFRSMWTPPCNADEQPFCKDMLPRFDAIYYKPSDKCRCYQRTWQECPPVHRRLKKVCCLDGIEPPEVLYRIKERCPKTACELDYGRLRRICSEEQFERDPTGQCTKIFWPCCKPARCHLSCMTTRRPTGCKKLRAPYPSYSEMRKKFERPRRPTECRCPHPIPLCEVMLAAERIKQV